MGIRVPPSLRYKTIWQLLVWVRKEPELRRIMSKHAYSRRAVESWLWLLEKGHPLEAWRCAGKSKQTGKRCGKWAIKGRAWCHRHGGRAAAGMASPNSKTGRYSTYLPKGLADEYYKATKDPRLLELADEIALLDTRTGELLKKLESGESRPGWVAVKQAFEYWEQAMNRQDFEAAQRHMQTMKKAIYRRNDTAVWAELQTVLEQRRKLVESERKRQLELENMLTLQDFMFLVQRVVFIIREEVTDDRERAKVSHRIFQLVNAPAPGDGPKREKQSAYPEAIDIEALPAPGGPTETG